VIHESVAAHARDAPEATALIQGGIRTSYGVLDAAASGYAAELAAKGIGPGHVIPVLLPRSPLLVAIELAVLKTGAAYSNLDLRWPTERIATIIRHISPALVIAASDVEADGFPVYRPPGGDLQDRSDAAAAAAVTPAISPPMTGAEPATVFFTSGTTGTAKGVVIPHRAVTRMFRPGGLAGFGPGHTTPQAAAQPWDMYAFELWGQLTAGGTCALIEGDNLLPGPLADLVATAGVSTLWITTSLFNVFVDEDLDCFDGLTEVLVGGERLSPGHVRAFLQRYPGIPVRNGYGPVENCMLTTTHRLTLADCDRPDGVPVGTAVPGTTVLVLDADDQPCGPHQQGEICAAGTGLAIGYLGDPALTSAKFVTVHADGADVRVYRTGDIGELDDDGVLHYRGRRDRQVKIAGHRVELEEIEVLARGLAGVRDCVALPVTEPDGRVTRLALFYLTDPSLGAEAGSVKEEAAPGSRQRHDDDPLGVRDALLGMLPATSVPGVVRRMSRLPVTANGKLDRAELARLARRPGRP
jgi:amino acid adenylation domain-containing protein